MKCLQINVSMAVFSGFLLQLANTVPERTTRRAAEFSTEAKAAVCYSEVKKIFRHLKHCVSYLAAGLYVVHHPLF